jgi:large subunit ribosomal protein L25
MSTMTDLNATIRTETGKGFARRARMNGQVPAVVYGANSKVEALYCESKDIVKVLRSVRGLNTLLNLKVEGGASRRVLIQDYQIHPVRRTLVHCDFIDVSSDQKITVKVPIRLDGKTEFEKAGGKRQVVFRELKVRCAPDAIPEAIVVNMEGLEELRVRLSELVAPEGTELLYRIDQPVVILKSVLEEEEEEEGEGEEAAAEGDEAKADESDDKDKKDKKDKKD